MKDFSLKYKSKKSVNEVTTTIKNEIEKSGFKVLNELDLSEKISSALDIDYDDYVILEVCNPKFAQEILSQKKSAGVFLPCKIALYQDGNETKIEFQKPTFISTFFYSKPIESITDKIETILNEVIKTAL